MLIFKRVSDLTMIFLFGDFPEPTDVKPRDMEGQT